MVSDFENSEEIINLLDIRLVEYENKYNKTIEKYASDLFDELKSLRLNKVIKSVARRLLHPEIWGDCRSEEWKNHIQSSVCNRNYCKNNEPTESVTVYTCITGGYDFAPHPPLRNKGVHYILFTDNTDMKAQGWEIKKIPDSVSQTDNVYINRYLKMHPHELFDTEFSIYIDGNIWFLANVNSFCEIARAAKAGVAMFAHGNRDCVYEEGAACKVLKRGNLTGIRKQLTSCRENRIPEHCGLLEACVVVSDLRSQIATSILNNWWKEFNYFQCGRDQLALVPATYKCGLTMYDFGLLGENARTDTRLHFFKHNQ